MRLNKTRGQETTLEQGFMGTTGLEPVTCAQPPALLDRVAPSSAGKGVNPHSARVWHPRHTQHQTPSIKQNAWSGDHAGTGFGIQILIAPVSSPSATLLDHAGTGFYGHYWTRTSDLTDVNPKPRFWQFGHHG